MKKVLFDKELLKELLEAARKSFPKEMILLLRGKVKKKEIFVNEFVVPPMFFQGFASAGFNPYLIPMDASIIGSVHSHPSGNPNPSVADLNNAYGFVIVILTYPFLSVEDVHVYDRKGEKLIKETV